MFYKKKGEQGLDQLEADRSPPSECFIFHLKKEKDRFIFLSSFVQDMVMETYKSKGVIFAMQDSGSLQDTTRLGLNSNCQDLVGA